MVQWLGHHRLWNLTAPVSPFSPLFYTCCLSRTPIVLRLPSRAFYRAHLQQQLSPKSETAKLRNSAKQIKYQKSQSIAPPKRVVGVLSVPRYWGRGLTLYIGVETYPNKVRYKQQIKNEDGLRPNGGSTTLYHSNGRKSGSSLFDEHSSRTTCRKGEFNSTEVVDLVVSGSWTWY